MSPPLSGYAHVTTDPKDNFIDPDVRSTYTSGLDGVTAKMVVIDSAFPTDGCRTGKSKNAATLQIFRNKKLVMTKNYSGFTYLSGPRVTANLRLPPSVTVDFVDVHETYLQYVWDKKTGKYKELGDGPEPANDEKRAEPPVFAQRHTTSGALSATMTWNANWGNLNNGGTAFSVEIKKGSDICWSDKIALDVPGMDLDGRSIECFGPIILPFDGGKKQFVTVRCLVPVKRDNVEDQQAFDFVFYDDGSKKFKFVSQNWSGSLPHLADHDRDGNVEFITQDYDFGKPFWTGKDSVLKRGSGGPMQIWRWQKDKFVNVTRELPKDLKRHAAASLKQFKSEPDHPEGYLLGYVGDLFLLGEQKNALNVLEQLATPNTVKQKDVILDQFKEHGYLRR